jgi:hypothetical protein
MCILGVLFGQVALFDLLYSYSRAQELSLFFRRVFENAMFRTHRCHWFMRHPWADFITAMVGFKVFGTHTLLAEASVDLKALARNALALFGRQEQRQTCDVVGRHRIGNSLTHANFSDLLLVREPQPTLALGDHHAGRDG